MQQDKDRAKILVVDDDKNLLDIIHMRLEASGYDVVAVDHENLAKEAAFLKNNDKPSADM